MLTLLLEILSASPCYTGKAMLCSADIATLPSMVIDTVGFRVSVLQSSVPDPDPYVLGL